MKYSVSSFSREYLFGISEPWQLEPVSLPKLVPKPISAFENNPLIDEIGAVGFVGVNGACLKKGRQ